MMKFVLAVAVLALTTPASAALTLHVTGIAKNPTSGSGVTLAVIGNSGPFNFTAQLTDAQGAGEEGVYFFGPWSGAVGSTAFSGLATVQLYEPYPGSPMNAAFSMSSTGSGLGASLNFGEMLGSTSRTLLPTDSSQYSLSPSYGWLSIFSGISNTARYSIQLTRIEVSGTNPSAEGPVPEPASWMIMVGGFGLVGGAMRARRKVAVSLP
jgi:hypothetical protein